MRVAAADEAKLVRIHAEHRFKLETVLQRRARILELKHVLRLCDTAVEVALVPDFKIGELVIGRQVRMRLAGALGLGDFVKPLPLVTRLHIFAVNLFTERFDDGEHPAVT